MDATAAHRYQAAYWRRWTTIIPNSRLILSPYQPAGASDGTSTYAMLPFGLMRPRDDSRAGRVLGVVLPHVPGGSWSCTCRHRRSRRGSS